MTSFSDFNLNKQLLMAVEEVGYEVPTPIQEKAIPLVQAGHDLFGIAQTGTGKTAAYVLPLLMKIKYAQGNDPRVLILAPTRELALQIESVILQLGKYTDLRTVALYGGLGPRHQIAAVEKGCDIIVASPGRFLDIYLKGHLVLKHIKTLVLDEADKMMDMGFMPQIRRILEIIPVKRQNLLFSATMPDKVVELSHEFLDFPEKIEITPQATAVETVSQQLYYLPNMRTKINFLEYFFNENKEELKRVIIFVKKKQTADNVFKYINRLGYGEARVIHANKGQNSRMNAVKAFSEGEVNILVSTDVTARGIDITDVSHVINFDVPLVYEDYVHRIGRTGRAKKSGIAITLCTEAEKYHIEKIEKLVREKIPVKRLPDTIKITETPLEEKQDMDREIDLQKRKDDPEFKGAFHEKKVKFLKPVPKKGKKGKRR